jgi:hypothetical protein
MARAGVLGSLPEAVVPPAPAVVPAGLAPPMVPAAPGEPVVPAAVLPVVAGWLAPVADGAVGVVTP